MAGLLVFATCQFVAWIMRERQWRTCDSGEWVGTEILGMLAISSIAIPLCGNYSKYSTVIGQSRADCRQALIFANTCRPQVTREFSIPRQLSRCWRWSGILRHVSTVG